MVLHLLLVLTAVAALTFAYFDTIRPKNYPPGPGWLPIIGSAFSIKKQLSKSKYFHVALADLAAKYGPVLGLRVGSAKIVVVSDYDGICQVLSREEFGGRPTGFTIKMGSIGQAKGILFADKGPVWTEQRRFCLKYLRDIGMGRQRMDELISTEAAQIIDTINAEMAAHGSVQVKDFFVVGVINILWTMLAGKRFENDDPKVLHLFSLLQEVFKNGDPAGGLLNFLPWLRYIAPKKSGYKALSDGIKGLHDLGEEAVEECRKILTDGQFEATDLISAYLQRIKSNEEASQPMSTADKSYTDDDLKMIIQDFFMAGQASTSTSMEFVILYLVRFPDWQEKVRNQIFSVTGFNREPTLKDRPSLSYVDAFISEVQRHASNGPTGFSNRAIQDTSLNGFTIPKDTVLLTNFYSLNKNGDLWKDPEEFRPERFLNAEGQMKSFDHFMPFGYGPRKCLGLSLGKGTLFGFTASFLNKFTITSPVGEAPPSLTAIPGITLAVQPFKAVFTPNNVPK